MRNVNTSGAVGYFFENIFWTGIAFIYYRAFLFQALPGWEYMQSLELLLVLSLAWMGIGVAVTIFRRRNDLSVFVNALGGMSIYFSLSFIKVFPALITAALTAAVLMGIGYGALVLRNYFHDRTQCRRLLPLRRCVSLCALNGRTIAVCMLSVLMLFMAAKQIMGFPFLEAKQLRTEEVVAEQTEGQTIAQNEQTVLLLQEECWKELSVTERLQVMKTIADIEANYLGIPEVSVCAGPMDTWTLGHYVDETKQITLSTEHLAQEDAHTMLSTITHEMYHAYQHRLIELYEQLGEEAQGLYLFKRTEQYMEEFDDYVDGTDDYFAYITQACEADSDAYAQRAVEDYYDRIALILQEQ